MVTWLEGPESTAATAAGEAATTRETAATGNVEILGSDSLMTKVGKVLRA